MSDRPNIAATAPVDSPFHAGERALQERAGVRERTERVGRKMIRDFMPDQHREFFAGLPLVIVGSLDARHRPWASILVGRLGFMSSPDPHTLRVDAPVGYGDPLGANLAAGAPIGLLGIELPTRRRNRMNGTVVARHGEGFAVRVSQSFGNCPQYIQVRMPIFVVDPLTVAAPRPVHREGALLSAAARALVQGADTLFIATTAEADRNGGIREEVDVSHRGGKPGFVRVSEEDGRTVLTSPDFLGNFHFATLGNIQVNPHAGLLFIDFASGDLLSLTGEGEVVWDGPEVAAFAGAQRLLRLRVDDGVFIPNAVPMRWSHPEFAPQLARTGSWG